jgi:hypothetical protein
MDKHPRDMPNGSMLLLGVSYAAMETGKIWTYVLLKAGGLWYSTGTGPQAAGWGAVERWLGRSDRHLEFVEVVTGTERLWTRKPEISGQTEVAVVEDLIRSGDLRRSYLD